MPAIDYRMTSSYSLSLFRSSAEYLLYEQSMYHYFCNILDLTQLSVLCLSGAQCIGLSRLPSVCKHAWCVYKYEGFNPKRERESEKMGEQDACRPAWY